MTLALWCQASAEDWYDSRVRDCQITGVQARDKRQGLERGPLYFLSVSQAHVKSALKIFQQKMQSWTHT